MQRRTLVAGMAAAVVTGRLVSLEPDGERGSRHIAKRSATAAR